MNTPDAEERDILAAYETGELVVAQDSAEIRQRHQAYARYQLMQDTKTESDYLYPDTLHNARRKTSTGWAA